MWENNSTFIHLMENVCFLAPITERTWHHRGHPCVTVSEQVGMPSSERIRLMNCLETTRAVRGATARRAIVADDTRTQIRATAAAVAPAGHIEQTAGMAVRRRSVGDAPGVAGQGIDAGDDRRGHTRTPEDQPTCLMIGIIDGDTRVGIGICSHIGYCPSATSAVRLPGGLGDIGTTATARAAPDRLAPTA